MKKSFVLFAGLFLVSSAFAAEEVKNGVHISSPKDGAVVSSPVTVEMAVSGKTVHPAGEIVEGTGHHHLLVDKGCVEAGAIIGAGDGIVHFGKGQTEAPLTLAKGKHSITLQFANGAHVSYGKDWCDTIEVEVE